MIDNISHLEDSINYNIDSLPPLCDVLAMEYSYIDIGDCKLYCETEGQGPPMVMIHGGPGGTHHYFHPWFSQAANFCELIYYDQRGCGRSDFISGPDGYSFSQAVEDLDKLRHALGIEKWIVCGYSYGGAIAQHYTLKHPGNTLGMVLINPAPVLKDPALNGSRQHDYISAEEKQRIEEIYDLYRNREIDFLELLYNKGINGDWKRQNFYKPTKDELIRSSLYEWVNDRGFNEIMSESLDKYDFKGVFNDCPVPTLLCEGKWDLTWTAEKKDITRKNHPKAEFVLFEHSGHNIFYDESELFFTSLRSFIKGLKPVTGDDINNWTRQIKSISDI